MLEVEFNRKGLESPGLGVLLESFGDQSVASLLCSRICVKKEWVFFGFELGFFPPLRSVPKEGLGQILLKRGSLKIPLSTLEILLYFPWCEGRDFLRERNELK